MADSFIYIPNGTNIEPYPFDGALAEATAADFRTAIGAGTSSVSLPIAESDVTNLVSDLASLDSRVDTLELIPSPVWGAIGGTLANQTDLQTALNLKATAANPVFTGTVTIPDNALAIADTNGLQSALDGKQGLDTQLTSLAALSYTGNASKYVRINAGETDFEVVTLAGGGDLVSTNNLSDVTSAATAFGNIKQAASDTATGVIEIAIQSEMETGTDTTRAVTPGRQHFHPSAAKVWCASTQSSTTIQKAYNVASVADTSAGISTIEIATDMSDALYSVVVNAEHNSASGTTQTYNVDNGGRAVGTYVIQSWQVDGTEVLTDPSASWFSEVFGDI